jgi:hypothetical protein
MARKKKPTMEERTASIAALTAQQTELKEDIAGVQGGLLNMADVGQASYFSATKETALTKKDQLNFADVYNPLYEKMKDVRFTVGEDITTANNDAAFYVFNPETEAKRQTDEQMGAITKQNEEFDLQQQRITEFLKQEGEAQKVGVLEQYLKSVTDKAQTGYSKSTDAGFDMKAYNAAKGKDKSMGFDANRNRIYSYKLPEEVAAAKLQTVRDVETLRFRSDPTLQNTQTEKYETVLEKQLAQLNKSIAKQTKQQTKAANKLTNQAAKAARKAANAAAKAARKAN